MSKAKELTTRYGMLVRLASTLSKIDDEIFKASKDFLELEELQKSYTSTYHNLWIQLDQNRQGIHQIVKKLFGLQQETQQELLYSCSCEK